MATLEIKKVRKNYGTLEVIHGIDLFINNGEFCVLVGPSGCGKSTLSRVVAGLDDFHSGEVLVEGQKIKGPSSERGMVFQGYTLFPWKTVKENNNIIGLSKNGANVSLEPGGALELSGAQLQTVFQTCDEVNEHLLEVKSIADKLNIGFIGLGAAPHWKHDEMPMMPKGRYKLMSEYMDKVGTMGKSMMFRTCTVQVNLDFSSEPDMVQKMRVALALQPIATALFSNSPFFEGNPTGHKSWRSRIWRSLDPQRTGLLPFVFSGGFGFEAWTEYALDVPMYFVYRDGNYINALGQSFRDFMKGELPALPGELPPPDVPPAMTPPIQMSEARLGNLGKVQAGTVTLSQNSLVFQIGSNAEQTTSLALRNMRTDSLGTGVDNKSGFQSLANIDVTDALKAQDSMRVLDRALEEVSSTRGEIGAFQKNNLESNLNYLRIAHENVMSSESVIRDADMAAEMTAFTRNQIMTDSATAMLAQANSRAQSVLRLLQ